MIEPQNRNVGSAAKLEGTIYVLIFSTKDDPDPLQYQYEPVDYPLKTTSASIAHEMLHLFGASDLYSLCDADRYVEAMSRRLYPKSVMLGHTEGLQNNEVDEITAWFVGWRGLVP